MKITVDLPMAEWAQVMKHTKARTKSEAVARALAEFNRLERMAALDAGIRSLESEPTVPAEDVRRKIKAWTTG